MNMIGQLLTRSWWRYATSEPSAFSAAYHWLDVRGLVQHAGMHDVHQAMVVAIVDGNADHHGTGRF